MDKFTYQQLDGLAVQVNNVEHYADNLQHFAGALYPDNGRETTIAEVREQLASLERAIIIARAELDGLEKTARA